MKKNQEVIEQKMLSMVNVAKLLYGLDIAGFFPVYIAKHHRAAR